MPIARTEAFTIGGTVAGFLCSFAIPALHGVTSPVEGLKRSLWGRALGGALICLFLRMGKALFGRQRFQFAPGSRVVFTETSLVMPDHKRPYEEVFYRKSDAVEIHAKTSEIAIPREAMGLGDVKFMAAVGAFYGWAGVLFALTALAIIGSAVGVTLMACRRREGFSLIPYGPCIAAATLVWTISGHAILKWWLGR